jgi:hypothetical protein
MLQRNNDLDEQEPFDPADVTWCLRLYPVDVVDARQDISAGPKRLYAKPFRIAALMPVEAPETQQA